MENRCDNDGVAQIMLTDSRTQMRVPKLRGPFLTVPPRFSEEEKGELIQRFYLFYSSKSRWEAPFTLGVQSVPPAHTAVVNAWSER